MSESWNRSGFTISSPIVRVVHNLTEDQSVHMRGAIALVDRQSSVASLIASQRLYPSAEAEVFVFPSIINLDVTGIAARVVKSPVEYSWSWVIQVDSWVDLEDEIKERFDNLEQRFDDVLNVTAQILGLLL